MAKWIYDGDCLITSCCNTAYDINKFERKGELIYLPCECPKCGARMIKKETVGRSGNSLEISELKENQEEKC